MSLSVQAIKRNYNSMWNPHSSPLLHLYTKVTNYFSAYQTHLFIYKFDNNLHVFHGVNWQSLDLRYKGGKFLWRKLVQNTSHFLVQLLQNNYKRQLLLRAKKQKQTKIILVTSILQGPHNHIILAWQHSRYEGCAQIFKLFCPEFVNRIQGTWKTNVPNIGKWYGNDSLPSSDKSFSWWTKLHY
jgi:hypothetical protein